jgi:hypothetical protein
LEQYSFTAHEVDKVLNRHHCVSNFQFGVVLDGFMLPEIAPSQQITMVLTCEVMDNNATIDILLGREFMMAWH